MESGWLYPALIGLLFLTRPQITQAQNVCQNPGSAAQGNFTLEKERVCLGSPVRVTGTTLNIANVSYDYNYTGGALSATNRTTNTSFTYTQPGSYTILQVGSSGQGSILCKTVTVLPLEPVKFTVKACSGRVANIELDESSLGQYDTYLLRWGDGLSVEVGRDLLKAQRSHTYNNNGPYTISITGKYAAPANCSGPVSQAPPVNFGTVAQPIINRLTTVNDNAITINYQAGTGSTVQLYRKDGSGNYKPTGQSGNGSAPFTVQTNAKQVQCFQLVAQDACNNEGVRSSEVCSIVLDAKAENKQNNLSWEPYAGDVSGGTFKYYRIYRNGSPVGGLQTNRTSTTYIDNNKIECGTSYCYTVEATAGPAIITSAPACVTGVNGEVPSEFRNLTVSLDNNQPRLVASLPVSGTTASYTLVISRSDKGGAFQPVGSVDNRNTFIDATANASTGSYCYQVAYQNNCGLTSPPSPPVCTVHLSSKGSNSIDWTGESPFLTGPPSKYVVEVIDSLNGTREEIDQGTRVTYEPDPNDPNLQSQKYRIIAVSSTGIQSYSNFYTLRREAKILAPDAFTPDGDGINDTFLVRGLFFDTFRLTIYDRWGAVLYSTTDKSDGWDGNVNGQPAAPGQYMYKVEVRDMTGQQTVRTGGLLLIR